MGIEYPSRRWAWIEVDLGAIRRNARAFKALLEPGVRMMCAVKADAYGHGAVECARALSSAGASQFAVATVDEGIQLRRGGITEPILMLNESPMEALDDLLQYDIMPAVFTTEYALAYGERAVALGKVGRYHLAVDTGMSRIGVMPQDAVAFRRAIEFHRGIECAGTFTHFATADVIGDWDFRRASERFMGAVSALREAGLETGLVHCDNTPGTVLHPELHNDMCRVGIGLYGLQPAETTAPRISLEPAMSVRARVTRVAEPAVGEGVSYGLTYRVSKPRTKVCTVPVGYADGLSRALSNNMDVIVDGQRAHQVGRICMDQFMFAVEPPDGLRRRTAPQVERGQLVTILGRDGEACITADELAQRLGTINYEITCDLGMMRLQRVFV